MAAVTCRTRSFHSGLRIPRAPQPDNRFPQRHSTVCGGVGRPGVVPAGDDGTASRIATKQSCTMWAVRETV